MKYTAFLTDACAFFDVLLDHVRLLRAASPAAYMATLPVYFNLLIYRGDLARYRGQVAAAGVFPYDDSRLFYVRAQMLIPASGRSHCQLAILSNSTHDAVDVAYRYCRGLFSEEPASVAKDNLLQILEKYRQYYVTHESCAAVKVCDKPVLW